DEVLCRESGQRPLPPDELALDPLHYPGQVLLEVHAADPLQAGDETPARDGEHLTQRVRAMVGEQADGHRPGRTLPPWSRQAETAHLADMHDDVATARLTNWDPSGHLPHPLYSVLQLVGRGQHA